MEEGKKWMDYWIENEKFNCLIRKKIREEKKVYVRRFNCLTVGKKSTCKTHQFLSSIIGRKTFTNKSKRVLLLFYSYFLIIIIIIDKRVK